MGSNNDNNNNKGVFPWLKSLPVAPEYHPTLAEFKDPIAYVYKIEPEASKYGICKIIPPLPNVSKKMVVANFNKSVTTFTTRQQQIGFCPRKHRPVQRPVWQSGERYTLPEFEAKAKAFERSYLRKRTKKVLTALEMESLYWEASGDKVITVEYANDMPGSAFGPVRGEDEEEEKTVGDTAWNMRAVSRAKGSLLRFMKAEIPGVTSPMVYISMLFSWFAWHVEDHDLHSLNFMHMGAGKTWYGVPRGASVAFEEVIRVHGYGGEINPLATFATLGEKTTVMSPEVLVNAGVPCCRLMQNAGEFVVTFPRAYHSGFSHGYNCGEAANIATPEWLRVAKEAAIRRASINCPPMVSHFQLLYDLALSFCSRIPKTVSSEPKSSRLRDRKKGEGETFIKESFVKDVMTNNDLLHVLGDGASVVLLPQSSLDDSNLSNSRISSLLKGRLSVGLISPLQEVKSSKSLAYGSFMPVKKSGLKTFIGANPKKGNLSSKYNGNKISLLNNSENGCNIGSEGDKPTDQGLFSCVTCGILNFACVAIVQPTEIAAKHLMSTTDGSFFDCQSVGSGVAMCLSEQNPRNGKRGQSAYDLQLYDIPVHSDDSRPLNKESKVVISDIEKEKGPSSLGLLALAYGNSSDSEEEVDPVCESESRSSDDAHDYHNNFPPGTPNRRRDNGTQRSYDCSSDVETNDVAFTESNAYLPFEKTTMASVPRCNEDSSKLHLFCVHHAAEVVQLLRPIGGAHVFLLCHPDYPELEAEAKLVAEEMGISYVWNDIRFREATEEDENQIRSALQCEEGLHGNADWTVKLGINLFYTVNLSRSPLYSKQMAYNSIIYKAFGRSSQDYNATQTKVQSKVLGRQKKIVTAGKWCGKVWMSNQVHPLLAVRETEEEEEKREADTPENPEVKREREIYSRKKPQLKQERMLEKVEPSQFTSTIRKSMRKRKSTFKAEKLLEGKTTKTEDSFNASDYSGDETIPQPRRTLRNKKPKKEVSVPVRRTIDRNKRKLNTDDETEDSFNASDDETILQPMRTLRNKKPQKEVSLPVKRTIDRNKRKLITDDETEDSFNASDDSGHETIPQPMRTLRNKKPKKEVSVPARRTIDRNKRKLIIDDEIEGGPSTRLRRRIVKPRKDLLETNRVEAKPILKRHKPIKKMKRPSAVKAPAPNPEVEDENEEEDNNEERECTCDIEGCTMRFSSKEDLIVHKRNVCLIEGCGKKFFSHKYLLQHRRVHEDDRPLKCPWKGCHMAFKWAWARTEHIRVHTGARPYVCLEEGCGQTFRFVSDFSRHKRKTGHSIKKNEG